MIIQEQDLIEIFREDMGIFDNGSIKSNNNFSPFFIYNSTKNGLQWWIWWINTSSFYGNLIEHISVSNATYPLEYFMKLGRYLGSEWLDDSVTFQYNQPLSFNITNQYGYVTLNTNMSFSFENASIQRTLTLSYNMEGVLRQLNGFLSYLNPSLDEFYYIHWDFVL